MRQAYPLWYARSRSSGGLERSLPHHHRPPVWGWMPRVLERATTGKASSTSTAFSSLPAHSTLSSSRMEEKAFTPTTDCSPRPRGHGGRCSLQPVACSSDIKPRETAACRGPRPSNAHGDLQRQSALLIHRRAHQCRCRNTHHHASNSPPCPFFVTSNRAGPSAWDLHSAYSSLPASALVEKRGGRHTL